MSDYWGKSVSRSDAKSPAAATPRDFSDLPVELGKAIAASLITPDPRATSRNLGTFSRLNRAARDVVKKGVLGHFYNGLNEAGAFATRLHKASEVGVEGSILARWSGNYVRCPNITRHERRSSSSIS
jgi:hypothetical protein